MEDKYLTLGETLTLVGGAGVVILGALAAGAWLVTKIMQFLTRRP